MNKISLWKQTDQKTLPLETSLSRKKINRETGSIGERPRFYQFSILLNRCLFKLFMLNFLEKKTIEGESPVAKSY